MNKEDPFTYVIEPTANGGYVWLLEGKQEEWDQMLTFYNEESLIEALEKYKKSSILLLDNSPILMQRGEQLAKKLNLQLQHP